ncbi:hypothetical protein Dsui_2843 [Azospira oryzae PS]|uniref:TniQ domain-containing protein n=1 Tax=Azospira oryzae (strain ATCC BAA-33 / DSM 13638 / PS) TaxID=640081 RepID=G8QFR9_AZOOP|nr:TniQ family protein [Azospira oryzae]AEV27182.1 hypothetical protein Dsui_2843 [Azospira oryzae PS]
MPANDLFFTPDYPGFADGRALPPRSRLFALEPIGLGTPMGEGLISYVIRLANAYSVSPHKLIMREFTKVSPGIDDNRKHASVFKTAARSINGLHRYSRSFTKAIEALCGLSNARLLTLLNLDELLPYNDNALIARHPRWCPACYRERLCSHKEIYHPLAWSFLFYRACSRHKCAMLDQCPTCGEFQYVIPKSSILGFCCHCGTSLAGEASMMLPEDHIDLWLALAVEEIVTALPRLTGVATRDRFVAQFNLAIRSCFSGSSGQFCKEMGLYRDSFLRWAHGNAKPTLPQWLTIAYCLKMGPVEFLERVFTSDTSHHELRKLDRKLKPRIRRPPPTKLQHDAIEAELRNQAACGDGTVSVATIAERHQLGHDYVRRRWPDLYATIRDAYKARLSSLAREEKCRKEVIVKEIVDELIGRGVCPTQRAVAVAVSRAGVSYADSVVRQKHMQLWAKWKRDNLSQL